MKDVAGKITGFVHIAVCETIEGDQFFSLHADNQDVLPILHIVEKALKVY